MNMSILFLILSVLYLLGCVALVAAILLQKKRTAGVASSIAGMGNAADTYWDKNKSRTMEGSLERLTKIGGFLLGLFAVVLCVLPLVLG
jgi:preprotein translocase subunit SecG